MTLCLSTIHVRYGETATNFSYSKTTDR